jgi:hypothetical protein
LQARGELAGGLQQVGEGREVHAVPAAAAHGAHAAARVERERERAACAAPLARGAVGDQVLACGGEGHVQRQLDRIEGDPVPTRTHAHIPEGVSCGLWPLMICRSQGSG